MKFMENFIKLMLAFGIGLLLVLLAMPKVIPFLHKMKFGQVEREEGLESHKKKGGTPTMGGVVFVLAAVIAAFVVNYKNITNPNLILITIVLVGYSLIGFIDDALIILKHQNEGLKAWQKFLMQAILAVYKSIPVLFCKKKNDVYGMFFDDTFHSYLNLGKENPEYYFYGAD